LSSEWQPIDTAPEDTSLIIAFDEPFFGVMNKEIAFGYFDSGSNRWLFDADFMAGEKELLRPTHWMKKPEPPK